MSDDLDRLIDRALIDLGSVEPRVGLADRVLARISDRPRRAWLWWALAGALAVILVALSLHPARQQPLPPRLASARLEVPLQTRLPKLTIVLAHRRRIPQPPPKLNVFPTSPPMTPEERALVRWAARDPQGMAKLFAEPTTRNEDAQ